MSTFPLYFRCIFILKSISGGKSGKFTIDIDDDDFEIPSDGEVEISEDQRIVDELVWRERERDLRASQRWIRSQTEDNALINSSKNILHSVVGYLTLQGESYTIRYNPIPNVT